MYGPLHNPPRKKTARLSGFTLVEMLITITIIGILAAGVLAALQGARETAKAAKTKSTITKLHYIIMARYDSYRTRRVPVETSANDLLFTARNRLNALRDLMRMEMPDRWSDVVRNTAETNPSSLEQVIPIAPGLSGNTPSINDRFFRLYREAVTKAGGDIAEVAKNAAAECLYMIVMSIPEAAEQFQNTEIGDVDGDGLKEFVDGWGHPIRFIRWPVGFVDFDELEAIDPDGPAGSVGGPRLEWSSPSDLQSGNRQEQPDPFDSMGVGGPVGAGPGFAIFPLIYSAGHDGIYDINLGFQKDGSGGDIPFVYITLDYYLPDGNNDTADSSGYHLRYIGQPLDAPSIDKTPKNDALDHYDNIHNHRLEVR